MIARFAIIAGTATLPERDVSAMITCTSGPRRDAPRIMTAANWRQATAATPILWTTTAAGWACALRMDLRASAMMWSIDCREMSELAHGDYIAQQLIDGVPSNANGIYCATFACAHFVPHSASYHQPCTDARPHTRPFAHSDIIPHSLSHKSANAFAHK